MNDAKTHNCENCRHYYFSPVEHLAICLHWKNQKCETKATWKCPEWAERVKMINDGMFTSTTDQWATPRDFFDKVNKEFDLEVDVCADEQNAKLKTFFSKEIDGLAQNWGGRRCWCNPPYGRQIGDWVKKAHDSNTLVVMLLPARTDTKWFHEYIYNNAEIRFIKGRLKFGDSKNSAPFPSMIVIFTPKGEQNNE